MNLIELIPNNHPSIKCKKISKILNLNYKKIELQYILNKESENGDIKIEINQLENNLEFFSQSSVNSPLLKDVTEKLNKLTSKLFIFKERINKIKASKKDIDITDKNNQEVT